MPFLCEMTSEQITVTMSLTKARHQPNLCNVHTTPLTQDEDSLVSQTRMKNAFTLQKNSVWNPVQSHVKLLASVHLQISTDYIRESCMTILQVTYYSNYPQDAT